MSLKQFGTPTNISSLSKSDGDRTELDAERKKLLAEFQKNAGIRFKNSALLNSSFMHRSVSNETGQKGNNERLEFLGDAILGAAVAALLYQSFAEKSEGELAKIKSVVVSEGILSGIARNLQVDRLLLLGRGEELSDGRNKKALLADALEALIGALYLDSGYKAAYDFISHWIGGEIQRVINNQYAQDYKSLLQELSQHAFKAYPAYMLLKQSGPDHDRLFWIEVHINGKSYGPGVGKNKKSAEQEAARIAYLALQGASSE